MEKVVKFGSREAEGSAEQNRKRNRSGRPERARGQVNFEIGKVRRSKVMGGFVWKTRKKGITTIKT